MFKVSDFKADRKNKRLFKRKFKYDKAKVKWIKYEDGNISVLDSGSSHVLSSDKDDFEYLESTPTVKLNAADGDVNGGRPVGYKGRMK